MSKLLVGTGKVCITPPDEMMPALSFLPVQLEGVYRNIFVRAIVLDNVERRIAIIVIESGDMSRTEDLQAALKKNYDFEPDDLFFTVTHTHEAPSFASEHKDIKKNPKKLAWVVSYGDFIIEKTLECVREAISSMRKARWGIGTGESYINVCRDQQFEDGTWDVGYDFKGPSDKELGVLKFVDYYGKTIAVILNYAVHGTACFFGKDEKGEKFLISGDLPGMVSDYLEERYESDNTIFLWTSGAAGNQAPILFPTYERFNHDHTHEQGFSSGYACWGLCEHMAQTQSIDAIRIIDSIQSMSDEMKITSVDKTIILPSKSKEGAENETPVKLAIKLITLNDVALLGIGGEVVSEIGFRLKEISPLKHTFIVTHISERIDYLPDKRGFDNQTFEGKNTCVKDGCAEEYIANAMLEMFNIRLSN